MIVSRVTINQKIKYFSWVIHFPDFWDKCYKTFFVP
jgi:hypothetical protein